MFKFFIELYESIIDSYSHLIPDESRTMATHSSHYIITINDPSRDPPIATYEQFFMGTQHNEPYSLKQLSAEVYPPATLATTPRTTQSSSNSLHQTTLEEIRLQDSTMLPHIIIDDYSVIEPQPNIVHEPDNEWEFVNCQQ